jgi:uncharacterized protein with NAD-binding domain and iron-sulfur cluster
MSQRVAILGGGIGGMSAAHELAQRGFDVVVYEDKDIAGGKARSMPVPDTGVDGRPNLPGEHGFRFFPGFYRHLFDTMKRIPFQGSAEGVLGNLVETSYINFAQAGGRGEVIFPLHFANPFTNARLLSEDVLKGLTRLGLSVGDVLHLAKRLFVLVSSCEERRFAEFEYQSWWDFSGAENRSSQYKKVVGGLTRSLVAAQAKEMSARTGGSILLQLQFHMAMGLGRVDRLLNAPTNDAWITPWLEHLRELGVDYRLHSRVQKIHCSGNRITGITVSEKAGNEDGNPRYVEVDYDADYYVAALPVEIMQELVKRTEELKQAEPRLSHLAELKTRWMNGVMFYLDSDVPMMRGHAVYIDSPWALTSISQAQFWDGIDLTSFGDGKVEGILSVDVSDWEYTKGLKHPKIAMNCTKEEVIDEVWAQLKAHLNDDEAQVLEDINRLSTFIDTDISWPNPTEAANLEPMLINTPGSWDLRPDATTSIENLFLAADYVRTYTDLATMEAANEAARRAVNGILDMSNSHADRCDVWPLSEPRIFAPLRLLDKERFTRGLPNWFAQFSG